MPPSRRTLLALLLLASLAGPGARTTLAQGQATGWFALIWEDPRSARDAGRVLYVLTEDGGRAHELELDVRALGGFERIRRLHGQRVSVDVDGAIPAPADAAGARRRLRVRAIRGLGRGGGAAAALVRGEPVSGTQAYVTLLCRFADLPNTVSHDAQWYTSLLTGGAFPGLDHYWREVSDGRVNMAGSRVAGWYTLPKTRAQYGVPDNVKLSEMFTDCTAAADADVDFRLYAGVNTQYNTDLGPSWGGGSFLQRDGIQAVVPATWMASWATQHTYAHEIGHSFGLPHSSGDYTTPYDSWWDVMSNGMGMDAATNHTVGVHTIAYHKDLLGWIPPARKYVAEHGVARTLTLERSGTPPAGTNFLSVEIPISGGEGYHYTVEARRREGYDRFVPAEAVVIHRVQPDRDRPARVVDTDGDRDPNDDGARFLPGMTFTDPAEGLIVRVNRRTASGWEVTIDWAEGIGGVTAGGVIDQLLGTGALTAQQVRYLDVVGNHNGRLDVGDVRAWMLQQAGQIDPALRPVLERLVREPAPAPSPEGAEAPRTPDRSRR